MIAVQGAPVGLRRTGLDGLDVGVAFRPGAPGLPLELNLVSEAGFRLVHFKLRPESGDAVLDWEGPAGWGGRPISVGTAVATDRPNVLRIRARSAEAGSDHRALAVELNGEMLGLASVDAAERPRHVASNFPETSVADFAVGSGDGLLRFAAGDLLRGPELGARPGLTAVTHIETAGGRLRRSLMSVAAQVTEIVAVNESRDAAVASIAAEVRRTTKILRLFQGSGPPLRPRADLRPDGAPAPAPASRSAAVLPRVRTSNVLLWSPGRIALPDVFETMVGDLDLLTRTDPFALWAEGVRIYDVGGRLFADVEGACRTWMAVSRTWNAEWDAGEDGHVAPDPEYLARARVLSWPEPAFAEVVALEPEAVAQRPRRSDDDRAGALMRAMRGGSPPAGFQELSDLKPHTLGELAWTPRTRSSVPAGSRSLMAAPSLASRVAVFCVSHKGAPDRQAVIRVGWAAELTRLGVPVYFVVGDHPARRAHLQGDVLHTPARDSYEHLPGKILELVRYAHDQGFDHLIKVDDDCVINPATLLQRAFAQHDYCGGVLATADQFRPEWHVGKCANDQLDAEPVELGGLDAWFAGGAGYALSRRAMGRILEAEPEVRAELLEDVAVGRALAAGGVTASESNRILSCLHFSRLADLGPEHEPVDIVWDVPAAELEAVHAVLGGQSWSQAAVQPWTAMLKPGTAPP